MPTFIVADLEKGKRLDKFLSEKIPEVSRTVLAKLADDGHARVDGELVSKSFKVKFGHVIEFTLPELGDVATEIKPEVRPLDVLYEDEDIAILSKPPGLCVHPSPGHWAGTLVNAALSRYPQMALVGSIRRPGVVHRLDQDTSGAIALALTPVAYQGLTGLIRTRQMKREYLAVVYGEPELEHATINMPIGRDPLHRRRFTVLSPSSGKQTRQAVTHFDVMERFGIASLLRVKLDTGRTHQIRVHMKRIGHPVCADTMYAGERPPLPITRQALHAHTLAFPHPRTGREISVTAPIPEDIALLLEFLRAGRS